MVPIFYAAYGANTNRAHIDAFALPPTSGCTPRLRAGLFPRRRRRCPTPRDEVVFDPADDSLMTSAPVPVRGIPDALHEAIRAHPVPRQVAAGRR